jgi:ABC-2 type transport system permease protein
MTQAIPSNEMLKKMHQGRMRRLKALVIKESFQIIRDPSTILISVVLPLLLLFLYGFGVSLDLNHLRLGLVLEDTAPDAMDFAHSLLNSRYFDVKLARDRRELIDDLIRGNIRGIVVVPSYFSAFRARPATIAPIQVIADGSEPNTANFVQYYVQGAYLNWLQEEQILTNLRGLSIVNVLPRFWYNEQLESRFFLLSGSLAIIMTLIGTLLTALVVSREWERGTMEALMSTTISRVELVAGKVIPYFILGMVSMAICVTVSVIGYGLPLRGSWWLLGIVSALFLFCALGFGLLISTLCKSQLIASQISITVGFLPAYILSGFLFEISSMPYWIQLLTYVIPAKYFVQCLQTLFLVGNVWSLILFNMIPMFIIGLLFFILTAFKTVKRLD